MGRSKSFYPREEEDDYEFDEAYFREFYKPLSNLPTPPPSSRDSSAPPESPQLALRVPGNLNLELLGSAAHLSRMLPPGASFITPSVQRIHDILACAKLPMDIIALGACILDSLKSPFSHSWRLSFPLARQDPAQKRHTLPPGPLLPQHIDQVSPEVIIMCALVVAFKFVEDSQDPTQYFMSEWAQGQWSCAQINFTERCIMASLGYRIMPLWNAKCIKEARHDIEMARRELVHDTTVTISGENEEPKSFIAAKHYKSMSSGHAVLGLGNQLTPAETPCSDLCTPGAGCGARDKVGRETAAAFSSFQPLPGDYLHLPSQASRQS